MSTQQNARKVFLKFVILALMVLSAAVPLNNAMAAVPHAWVSGLAETGTWYWQPDLSDNVPGMTSDEMYGNYIYGGLIQGYTDTLGTVKLSVSVYQKGGWWIEGYADILDTYTFTDLNNPAASGPIAGLYGKIDYSGTLSSGNAQGVGGFPNFFIAGVGGASLKWNGVNYDLAITGQPTIQVDNPVQHVIGSFTIPINGAYYGQPFDHDWYFRVYANNPATAGLDISADFYNTAEFSFYTDGFPLGVTSIGGYSQGFNTSVPEPSTFLLLGAGLGALALLKRKVCE
jgi:hypothetical protein